MVRSRFEDLLVFQEAEALADEVWEVVRAWEPFAKRTVGGQLARAADSVGANIAEGVGRQSRADTARFVRIAQGSLFEVKFWLRRAHRRGLLAEDQTTRLKTRLDALLPLLGGYHRSLKTQS